MKATNRETPTTPELRFFARAARLQKRSEQWPLDRKIAAVRRLIWAYFEAHPRSFPWRSSTDPYRILVSEVMLQQTQTARVLPKYRAWLRALPTVRSLAQAPLPEVLSLWQGLGYNRRAVALRNAAREIVAKHGGRVPLDITELEALPGVGRYTASAVCAFAANQKTVLIETNIRTVVLYFFFAEREGVHDSEIEPLVARLCPAGRPREWYYAMMDFGVLLKRHRAAPNSMSRHYRKQTPFAGSVRQLRGEIVRSLLERRASSVHALAERIGRPAEEVTVLVERLKHEGLVSRRGRGIALAEGSA